MTLFYSGQQERFLSCSGDIFKIRSLKEVKICIKRVYLRIHKRVHCQVGRFTWQVSTIDTQGYFVECK